MPVESNAAAFPRETTPASTETRMSIVTGSSAAWRTSFLVSGIPTSRCWLFPRLVMFSRGKVIAEPVQPNVSDCP